jgi:hypothetical protein
VTQALNEGMEIVLPEGTTTRMVSQDTFTQYQEALSGLTQDNLHEITERLVQLGLASGPYPPPGQ